MIRRLLLWSLLCSLVLTAQSVAQMRWMPGATGQMILCIDGQAVQVFTDAEGQPTAPPHPCPDCIGDLPLALLTDLVAKSAPVSGEAALPRRPDLWSPGAFAHLRARGPPAFL